MSRSQSWTIRRRAWPRQVSAVGLVSLLGGLAACQGKPAGEAGGAAGQHGAASSGAVPAEKVASCAGFTAEKAAQLLGVPASDIRDQSEDVYDRLRSCSFVSAQDSGKRVSFSLRRDDSVEAAADEMASFREHLGVAQGALGSATGQGSKGAAYEEVSGLGDEAVWTRVNGTLNVRKGNVSILVMLPADRDAQKRLAEMVVAGLS